MKKIIYIIGIFSLVIVFVLNLLMTANLDIFEHITIHYNSIIYILALVLVGTLLFFISNVVNKQLEEEKDIERGKEIRKDFFLVALILYILFNIIWILKVNPFVLGDSVHVCNFAQSIFQGNVDNVIGSMTYAGITLGEYMQGYSQQIPLAFVYSIFFRVLHFDVIELLRIINVISNAFIVVAVYKINQHLSKKYQMNKILGLTLILTFLSLPMLSTFVYGDIPSLALSLFSVYFMMKYIDTKEARYAIIASLLTMVAYMMRMNSLIFIIATVIYLCLNLVKEINKKALKENILNAFIIVVFIAIAIFPSSIIKNYYFSTYHMDKQKAYPNISYLLMAMEESPRGNGWYNEAIGEKALRNPEEIKEEYYDRIKSRLGYFSKNMGYTCKFYTMKIASMWTENTYSAVRNNAVRSYSIADIIEEVTEKSTNQILPFSKQQCSVEDWIRPLTFYQKVLLIITTLCSLIVLIQNRKNLSLEVLFLLTIFIGGFTFHILWEAKSRYIIPYIIVLIPITSIKIRKWKRK